MSNRPWAFIGGGGSFIWIDRPHTGWTEVHSAMPSRMAHDKHDGMHTYDFMLNHLALVHQNDDDPQKCCSFNWGRKMIPVFEDEQITWTLNKRNTRYAPV